jgi:D-alanine transaminase
MSRIAYVNGAYVPHREAQVHVEDRGYQFADAVYEVIAVRGGGLVDEAGHLARLKRSLAELRIRAPMRDTALRHVIREMVARNGVRDGIVYMQVSRGVARRDHPFPAAATKPAIVMTARRMPRFDLRAPVTGIKILTVPDIRWQRCDIKSVSLLPNILAKQQAREAGAYEAWQVDADGRVTEGASTNAWIVTKAGELVTRSASNAILNGITRLALIAIAAKLGVRLVERSFTVAEAKEAREAFITSATSFVLPVVQVDDRVIGNGEPGSISLQLREAYADHMDEAARRSA